MGKVAGEFLYYLLLVGSVLTALPILLLIIETIAAISTPAAAASSNVPRGRRARLGVLIPAHDEEMAVSANLPLIQSQLHDGDRLLVVADNCADHTAEVARKLGAEVAVRSEAANRGKGFALEFGIRHFQANPPEVVVVMDADCVISEFGLGCLAEACATTNRPVQALDLMLSNPEATPVTRLREFAWRVKNQIRPTGLNALGLPCQLMGTGMAFPWEVISRARLATGALAEDLKIGLELAAAGYPATFCPAATVTSEFPTTDEGSRTQQRRWEQGHLAMIAAVVPKLLVTGLRRRDVALLALSLDAAVPPLSLLSIMVLSLLILSAVAWQLQLGSLAFDTNIFSALSLMAALTACWIKVGRRLMTLSTTIAIVGVVFGKIPFYIRVLTGSSRQGWVRADRRKR